MTDLETLRRALRAPEPGLGRLPVGVIMARGRRLRRRRQALAAGGLACLAVALGAAGLGAAHLGRTSRPDVPAAGRSVRPGPMLLYPGNQYGSVIYTGIRRQAGELVFYVVRVHSTQLPQTTFGIMGGYVNAAGRLVDGVTANEFTGPDLAEGFHEPQAPISGVPEFGYYAGPVAKITGAVGGHPVRARLAHWSVNPRVVIFWFDPASDPAGRDVTHLAAVSAQGRPLPALHNGIGHG